MNTITPLTSIPALGSSTTKQGSQQQGMRQDQPAGEILKATVMEIRSGNRYLLDFAGTKILASSSTSLSVGQQLQLQVTKTTPNIELTIVTDFVNVLSGKPLVLLGNNIDLSTLFTSLKQSGNLPLPSLSQSSNETLQTYLPMDFDAVIGSKQGGDFVRQLFNRLGINLENLLAQGKGGQASLTLKAALLEVLTQYQGAEKITEQANHLLATLELYQFAQLQLSQQNLLLFPLPLPFFEQGFLLVENNDEGEEHSDESHSHVKCSLCLSLTELGNLKIDILKKPDGLFIKFFLDSTEKALFFESFSQELKSMLTTDTPISITFADTADSPASELIRRLLPEGESFLDTKV